jgi:hypothetical protein
MNERRRRSTRHTKCLRGRLYFTRNGRESEPCLILDAFYEGARIVVDHPTLIPDEVELYIPKKNRRAHASVRWRHGKRIGLALSELGHHADERPLRALYFRG